MPGVFPEQPGGSDLEKVRVEEEIREMMRS